MERRGSGLGLNSPGVAPRIGDWTRDLAMVNKEGDVGVGLGRKTMALTGGVGESAGESRRSARAGLGQRRAGLDPRRGERERGVARAKRTGPAGALLLGYDLDSAQDGAHGEETGCLRCWASNSVRRRPGGPYRREEEIGQRPKQPREKEGELGCCGPKVRGEEKSFSFSFPNFSKPFSKRF
jgi:hypothetical protein